MSSSKAFPVTSVCSRVFVRPRYRSCFRPGRNRQTSYDEVRLSSMSPSKVLPGRLLLDGRRADAHSLTLTVQRPPLGEHRILLRLPPRVPPRLPPRVPPRVRHHALVFWSFNSLQRTQSALSEPPSHCPSPSSHFRWHYAGAEGLRVD